MGEKRRWNMRRGLAALCALLLAQTGCEMRAEAARPLLSKKSITMVVGDTEVLRVRRKTGSGTPAWKSTDPGTAAVSRKGTVRAVKRGKAVISCEWKQGKKKKIVKCKVTVVKPAFRSDSLTLEEGSTGNVEFWYRPKKGSCRWSAENLDIASVGPDGTVEGRKAGKTTVRCVVTTGGKRFRLEASVRVMKKKPEATKETEPTKEPQPTAVPEGGGDNPGGGKAPGGETKPEESRKPGGGGEKPESRKDRTICEYDALHRLIRVRYEDGSFLEYIYDANGNITKVIKHTRDER